MTDVPTHAAAVAAAAIALAVSGCSGSTNTSTTTADRTFLQDMISHHRQAIEAGELAITHGGDPRVRAFGRRIVGEQTPELRAMMSIAAARHVRIDAATGARMAVHRITDADLDDLRARTGPGFDRSFLTLSATSEEGAAAMARTELAHGENTAARKLARSIAGAPTSEIPQLRALLRKLA